MLGEDEGVCHNHVLPARAGKNDYFGNVVGSQGLAAAVPRRTSAQSIPAPDGGASEIFGKNIDESRGDSEAIHLRIDGVGLGLVTIEADDGEFLIWF